MIVFKSKAFVQKDTIHDGQTHFTPSKIKVDLPEASSYRSLDDFVREMTMLRWLEAMKNSDPVYDYTV